MGPTTLHPTLHGSHLEKGCIGKESAGLLCLPIPEELFTHIFQLYWCLMASGLG